MTAYRFANQTVKINKGFAIRSAQEAIANARNLLKVAGECAEYYDWHRRTIEANKREIEAVLADPDTNWN
jgi:putative IMPACT (imprinted ancient) family translation regulator